VLLVVIVAAEREGLTSAGIGVLLAGFGACILLGALASPPLVAGFLLESSSPRATIAVVSAFTRTDVMLWGTLSPSISNPPSLDELEVLPTRA